MGRRGCRRRDSLGGSPPTAGNETMHCVVEWRIMGARVWSGKRLQQANAFEGGGRDWPAEDAIGAEIFPWVVAEQSGGHTVDPLSCLPVCLDNGSVYFGN